MSELRSAMRWARSPLLKISHALLEEEFVISRYPVLKNKNCGFVNDVLHIRESE